MSERWPQLPRRTPTTTTMVLWAGTTTSHRLSHRPLSSQSEEGLEGLEGSRAFQGSRAYLASRARMEMTAWMDLRGLRELRALEDLEASMASRARREEPRWPLPSRS